MDDLDSRRHPGSLHLLVEGRGGGAGAPLQVLDKTGDDWQLEDMF